MKVLKPILCIFLFAAGLVPIMPVLGEDGPQEEEIILRVAYLPSPKYSDPFTKAEIAVHEAFKKKYPYIKLIQFNAMGIENQGMDSKPLMAIAAQVNPDVMYVNFRQSDSYIQKNLLYPLDEYLKDIPIEIQNLRIAKPAWPVVKREGPPDGQGPVHVWALPYDTLTKVLMYRKDLFQKVGIPPDKPPKNWEELEDYAKRLTIPEENIFGISMGSAYEWMTLLWSAGGDAVVKNAQGQWHAVFDSDEAVVAADFYLRLTAQEWKDSRGNSHRGFVCRDPVLAQTYRGQGKIAMEFSYMSAANLGGDARVDLNLMGVAPIPKGPTGKSGSEINCRMWGIFALAGETNNSGVGPRDPQKVKDAAWKYIWFYDCEEAR